MSTMKGSPALEELVRATVAEALRRDPRATEEEAVRGTFARLGVAVPPPVDNPPPLVDTLADALSEGALSTPPDHARAAGRRLVLNNLKAAALAQDHSVVTALRSVVLPDANDEATVLWSGQRATAPTAALVNATAMEMLDFTETHVPTAIHVGVAIVPAVLAFAERAGVDGEAVVRGVVAGVEVELALGEGLMPTLYMRGFNPTAVCGAVGAAAGCAVAGAFDGEATRHALVLAASTVGGLFEAIGTGGWAYQAGTAARCGLMAGLVARAGMRSNSALLDGPKGLARAYSDEPLAGVHAAAAQLGERWRVTEASYKRFPTETITQGSLEAVIALRGQLEPEVRERVALIRMAVDPLVAAIANERYERFGVPSDPVEAQFDLRFTVASAFVHGVPADVRELFAAERLRDPRIVGLRDRVFVDGAVDVGLEGARAEALTLEGTRHQAAVAGWRGSHANPATDDEMAEHFGAALAHLSHPRGVVDAVAGIEEPGGLDRVVAAAAHLA